MDLMAKLKLIWFLSLCVLTAARTLKKVEVESLSETATNTDASRTLPKYVVAPVQTSAKDADNSIADSNKSNEIDRKTGDSNLELLKTSELFKDTKSSTQTEQTGDIVKENNLKLLQNDKILTKNCESEEKSHNSSENDTTAVKNTKSYSRNSLPKLTEDIAINKSESKLRSLTKSFENNTHQQSTVGELKTDSERVLNNANNSVTNPEIKQVIPIAKDTNASRTRNIIARKENLESAEKIVRTKTDNSESTEKQTRDLADAVAKEETFLNSANLIQPKIINAKDSEKESSEKIILREEKHETPNGENEANHLKSFTAFTTTSLPLLEKVRESSSQKVKDGQAGVEQTTFKSVANDLEKISQNLQESVPNIPIVEATKITNFANITKDSQEQLPRTMESNYIDVKATGGNQAALENDPQNLREITNLSREAAISVIPTSLQATPSVGISVTPAETQQQTLSVSTYPVATGISSTLQTQNPSATVNNYGTYSVDSIATTRRPATITATYPATYPALLPHFPLLPSISLPNLLLNPFNAIPSANNQLQNTFGFGIFATPPNWKQSYSNFLALNPVTETRPPLSNSVSTLTISRDFETPSHQGKTVKPTDAKINNTVEEHAASSAEFPNFNINKTEAQATIRGNPQVLHLFFPLKYLYPKQVATETDTVAKERKVTVDDGKDQLNELSGAAGENKSDHIRSKSDEKTSLTFKLDLPKPIVQFVRGVFDTFTPFMQN